MKRRDFIKTSAGIWIPNIWIQRADAQFLPGRSQSFRRQAAGVSYLVQEDFEGSGTPASWTNTAGSPNYDYTPALDGSESLFIDGTGTSTTAVTPSFSESSVWCYFIFQYSATPAANLIGIAISGSSTNLSYLQLRTTAGTLRLYHGTTFASVTGWSTGTTYHIWLRYQAGSGANGQVDLYRATTSTRPAVTASITTGTSTANAESVYFASNSAANTDLIIDKVRVSTSEIGSSPT